MAGPAGPPAAIAAPPRAAAGSDGPGRSAAPIATSRSLAADSSAYQIHVPRRSPRTTPASLSTRRWCEMVGWERPADGATSHAQTAPSAASSRTMASRAGGWRLAAGGWRLAGVSVCTR